MTVGVFPFKESFGQLINVAGTRIDFSVGVLSQRDMMNKSSFRKEVKLDFRKNGSCLFDITRLTTDTKVVKEDIIEPQLIYPSKKDNRLIDILFEDTNNTKRPYKFWENNPTMYFSKPVKMKYDRNIYCRESDRRVLDEVDRYFERIKYMNFTDFVRDFVLPINDQNSSFFVKEEGRFVSLDNEVTEKTISLDLLNNFKRQYVNKVNKFISFYLLKSQMTRSYNTERFLESNLLNSFHSLMQEYICFKIVKLKNCKSLLEYNRSFEKFKIEVDLFCSMAEEYLQHRNQINIFDYLLLLKKNLVRNEFLNIFVDKALNQSLITVTSIIQSIGFKHAPLKLLTANLAIEYSKDEDYNYVTKNIPKIFKTLIKKVLFINQNFLLLKNSCVPLYTRLLENKINLFDSMESIHFRDKYILIKKDLIQLRDSTMEVIISKLVS